MSYDNSHDEQTEAKQAANQSNNVIEKSSVDGHDRATWSSGADFFFSALGYAGK